MKADRLPLIDLDVGIKAPPAQKRRLRWIRAIPRYFWFRLREAIGLAEIRESGLLVSKLAASLKSGKSRPPQVFIGADRSLDLTATAWSHGVSEETLQLRILERRRQTARTAYVTFIIGWLVLGWWLVQGLMAQWTAGRLALSLEFIPFCGLFFLLALKNAWQNWQLRLGHIGSAVEYLKTDKPFWPTY